MLDRTSTSARNRYLRPVPKHFPHQNRPLPKYGVTPPAVVLPSCGVLRMLEQPAQSRFRTGRTPTLTWPCTWHSRKQAASIPYGLLRAGTGYRASSQRESREQSRQHQISRRRRPGASHHCKPSTPAPSLPIGSTWTQQHVQPEKRDDHGNFLVVHCTLRRESTV